MNPRLLSQVSQNGLIAAGSATLSFLTRFWRELQLPLAVMLGIAIAVCLTACLWKEEQEVKASGMMALTSGSQRVSRHLLDGKARLRVVFGLSCLILGVLLGRL